MHCRVHRPLRVLMCVANDLLVWKHSLVAHGATLAPPSPSGTIKSALSSSSDTVGACTRALGAATAAAEPGLEEEASPPASEEETPITLP
jgi:hypothetical protein